MAAPLLGPLAVAGLTLAGGALNAGAQASLNRSTQRWNERMYARQRQDALADWYTQQEYNSPAQMMARLKAAGLSPALAYGQVQNDAGAIRSSSVEGWSPHAPDYSFVGNAAAGGIATYQDMALKQAQVDNVKAQTDVARQDELLRAAQILSLGTSTESARFDLALKNRIKDYSVESARLGVAQQSLSLDKTAADTDLSRINFDKGLAEIGAIRAGTQVTLNRDERESAANASNLREAAARILNMRYQNAKSDAERRYIKLQHEALNQSKSISLWEQRLKERNIYPGDPWFFRSLELILDKLQVDKKDFGRMR